MIFLKKINIFYYLNLKNKHTYEFFIVSRFYLNKFIILFKIINIFKYLIMCNKLIIKKIQQIKKDD